MKTEIGLTLASYANMTSARYFQERDKMFDRGVQICVNGLRRYVKLPKDTQEITVCFYKRYVADSFEIGRRVPRVSKYCTLPLREVLGYCMIDHPNTQLLISFRSELYRYYINGFKFFRIEY